MNYRQGLRIVFNYVLPFIGALCVLFGVVRAIYVASFDRASTTMLGLGLVLFLMIFVRVELANIRFYLHVTLYTVLVAGLCVIAYLFVKEYERPIDLTREKLFSLTPQSQRFLESLDQPTTITVVSTDHVPYRNIQEYYDRSNDASRVLFDPCRNHSPLASWAKTSVTTTFSWSRPTAPSASTRSSLIRCSSRGPSSPSVPLPTR